VLAVAPETSGELPKGSEVALTVSKGPAPRTVPSGLAGKSYEEAAAAIDAVQLVPVRVEDFSDTVPAGAVIGLRPGEGAAVPRDSKVEVVVSKGPDLVTVPSVQGSNLEGAVAKLEAAGLTAGDVFGPANGRPFATDPPEGTQVKRGSAVNIYMAR
jgi:serine/threonine-protein kinase